MPPVAPDQRVASSHVSLPPVPVFSGELALEPRPVPVKAQAQGQAPQGTPEHGTPEHGETDQTEQALLARLRSGRLGLLEEARAFAGLARTFGWRQEDIGQALGRSRAAVANRMRLLDLAPPVRGALGQGRISVGHAKVLLGVKDAEMQAWLAEAIEARNLTVRATERLIAERLRRRNQAGAPPGTGDDPQAAAAGEDAEGEAGAASLPAAVAAARRRLGAELEAPVRIVHEGGAGRIEISYQGINDLQRLLNLMGLEE